jgi:hypothetical protein
MNIDGGYLSYCLETKQLIIPVLVFKTNVSKAIHDSKNRILYPGFRQPTPE